jgi:hypothetical protein
VAYQSESAESNPDKSILAAEGNRMAGQGAVYKVDDQGGLMLADSGSPVGGGTRS